MPSHSEKLLILSSAAIAAGVLTVVIVQPNLPGRWCPPDSQWLVCFRDWLVPLSGWAAAIAAAGFIAYERHKVQKDAERALHTARMRLATQLELVARRYIQIYFDIVSAFNVDDMPTHRHLPIPAFADNPGDLAILPPSESEGIFGIVLDVHRANNLSDFLHDIAGEFEQAAQSLQIDAANAAAKSVEWRDRLGKLVAWRRMDPEVLNYDKLLSDAQRHKDLHTPHSD